MARLGIIDIAKEIFDAEPAFWETYFPDCRVLLELAPSYSDEFRSLRRFKVECEEFDDLAKNEPIPFYNFAFQETKHMVPEPLNAKRFGRFYRFPPERLPFTLSHYEIRRGPQTKL